MRKILISGLIMAIAGLGIITGAQPTARGTGEDASKASAGSLGSTVADFKLSDGSGKSHTLASLKGEKGTIIVFMSVYCPMVKAYDERIIQLATDYKAKGVNLVGINSNFNEDSDAMRAHGNEIHYNFPILKDKDNKIADALAAQRTPETILLDANNRIVYRGRIDNSARPEGVQSSELRDAIGDMLAGRPVAKAETTAVGCSIKRPAK